MAASKLIMLNLCLVSFPQGPPSGELQSYIPQGCVSQPYLASSHLWPFWQEQVRTASKQQGGISDEDYP